MNTATFSFATVAPALPEIVLGLLVCGLLVIAPSCARASATSPTGWRSWPSSAPGRSPRPPWGARVVTFHGLFVPTSCPVPKVVILLTVAATLGLAVPTGGARAAHREFLSSPSSHLGMMVMASAQHFLTLYPRLELMALSQYALVSRSATRCARPRPA